MTGVTLDASIIIDAYAGRERKDMSLTLLEFLAENQAQLIEPKILIVEVAGVLVRYITRKDVEKALSIIEEASELIPEEEIWTTALTIALKTGSRISDSYYIATATLHNTNLITSDKPQCNSARKTGVKCIYLPDTNLKNVNRILTG